MLTEAEVRAALAAPSPVVAFDTSVIWSSDRFVNVINGINALNTDRDDKITKVVGALVHAEHLRQMRERLGERFEMRFVHSFLQTKQIEVAPFGPEDAEHFAEVVGRMCPAKDDWRRQKLVDTLRHLRIPDVPDMTVRLPGTADWFIGAQADRRGCLLVVDDKGPEFHAIAHRTSLGTLERALAA